MEARLLLPATFKFKEMFRDALKEPKILETNNLCSILREKCLFFHSENKKLEIYREIPTHAKILVNFNNRR